MIIGNFSYNPVEDSYSGEIKTLSFSRANVLLRPNRKSSDKEPDYRVVEQGPNGVIEFGAAWRRETGRGQPYLSIVLDDPALGQALNLAMFSGERDGAAILVWTRQRSKAVPEPAKASEPGETPLPPRSRRSSPAPRTARPT